MGRAKRLSLEELATALLELPPAASSLAWPAIFGNQRPVEIEVGCGKGLFLLTESAAHPDSNFLGVEIVRKYQLQAATRLVKRGRRNVKLVCTDARLFLRDWVAPASVQAIHVYFPDPWWKRRHEKRRLFTSDFGSACTAALCPGGLLRVATDVPDYFEMVGGLLATQKELERLPPTTEREPEHDLDYLTNFERKFRKAGKAIYRGDWRKGS